MFKDLIDTWKNVRNVLELPAKWRRIVVYSEGAATTEHLRPIILELINEYDAKVCFLTSERRDKIDTPNKENIQIFFIGEASARTYLFPRLIAKVVIMSTPSLETMQLKRSNITKYLYIHHSPVSTHMIYKEDAFDNFDVIFCVGPHHISEIKEREQLFSLPQKTLFKTGYVKFDELENMKHRNNLNISSIVVAPSWGPNTITNTCCIELIALFIRYNFEVIFRPHHMSVNKEKRLIENIRNHFSDSDNFIMDLDPNSTPTLEKSDMMVSDWSGIALEYYLSQKKPVIFMDLPPKVNNKNYKLISNMPIEVSMRKTIGEILNPEDIKNLEEASLKSMIKSASKKVAASNKFATDTFFNYGKSAYMTAKQINEYIKEETN